MKLVTAEDKKHENLLAYAFVTLRGGEGEINNYMTITGLTLWKSKFEGKYHVAEPGKSNFKYCIFGESFKKVLTDMIVCQYESDKEFDEIPIINL